MKDKHSDPYTHLYDSHNAIEEYYNLKRKLNLTDEERFYLKYRRPYIPLESDEVIFCLWQYLARTKAKIEELSELLSISRVTLSRILHRHETPREETLTKIHNFLTNVGVRE